MKLYFLLVASVFVPAASLATMCIQKPDFNQKHIASGSFRVQEVLPAVVDCNNKGFYDQNQKAPGCLLKLLRISKATQGNPQSEFLFYGGDGSCEYKIGKTLKLKMTDYCCFVNPYFNCSDPPKEHAEAIWACKSKAWYDSEKNEEEKFPFDFSVRGFEDTSSDPVEKPPSKLESILTWFKELF